MKNQLQMKNNIKVLVMMMAAMGVMTFSCSKKSDGGGTYVYTPTAPIDSNWSFETTPAWSDEFNYSGTPDTSKWTYDLGGGGWGNSELEDYTNSPDNVSVANGVLTITALKQSAGGENYTSTRIVSKGSITYGRIEVRAKLCTGRGTWPAIWMLPNVYTYGPWPASGEVDIMEMVGYDQNVEHFSAHNATYYAGNAKTSTDSIPGANTSFHLYREDWTPYAIRGYYDNNLVFTYVNTGGGSSLYPYNIPFHLLMNIAVGGSWGGLQGVDDSAFPTSMQIDYVHFFNIIHQK
jgi:beta-glucanase (GH16 family)